MWNDCFCAWIFGDCLIDQIHVNGPAAHTHHAGKELLCLPYFSMSREAWPTELLVEPNMVVYIRPWGMKHIHGGNGILRIRFLFLWSHISGRKRVARLPNLFHRHSVAFVSLCVTVHEWRNEELLKVYLIQLRFFFALANFANELDAHTPRWLSVCCCCCCSLTVKRKARNQTKTIVIPWPCSAVGIDVGRCCGIRIRVFRLGIQCVINNRWWMYFQLFTHQR